MNVLLWYDRYKKLFSIIYKHIIYIINTTINIKRIFYSSIDYKSNIYEFYMYINYVICRKLYTYIYSILIDKLIHTKFNRCFFFEIKYII